jgi:hypothetical protein
VFDVEAHDKGSDKEGQPLEKRHLAPSQATMDITKFVVSLREKALLYGDYSTYWSQLSGKLLNCRKKLNIATKSRGKFNPKAPVTPEQIAENYEYVIIVLYFLGAGG